MAEGVGFEPTIPLRVFQFSRLARSTDSATPPSEVGLIINDYAPLQLFRAPRLLIMPYRQGAI